MHALTHPHVAGAWGYSEYSCRYLMLLMLMFYGTLMFALEYARAAAMVATFCLLVAPTQRNVCLCCADGRPL